MAEGRGVEDPHGWKITNHPAAKPPEPYESVDHPNHYGGADNPYEAIKVIEAWDLGFNVGNAVKYLARAGWKPGSTKTEDIKKAIWYLQREVDKWEKNDG